jgi:hypothetical protein
MDTKDLVDAFELEGRSLDATLRHHPRLRPLFTRAFAGVDGSALKESYLRLLKLKADYVRYTVPALRAAGLALRGGDAEDQVFSKLFLGYATDETDTQGDYGHHVWALEDMRALGAERALCEAPPHPSAERYGRFFVDEAAQHPYAILGAKGVLEHFSIRVSDDLVAGILASGIPNAANAVSFFQHHGVLDIEHVRAGDRNLQNLTGVAKRSQVLAGAYFSSGSYRAMVHYLLPS